MEETRLKEYDLDFSKICKQSFNSCDDYLVIYEHSSGDFHAQIRAYLEVANNIVDDLKIKGIAPLDDIFLFPLINLYIHAIEFSLKL